MKNISSFLIKIEIFFKFKTMIKSFIPSVLAITKKEKPKRFKKKENDKFDLWMCDIMVNHPGLPT